MDGHYPTPRHHASTGPRLAVAAGVGVALALIEFLGGNPLRAAMALDPMAVRAGEYWRLVGAHFVQLGPRHLLLNLIGFALMTGLAMPVLTSRGVARLTVVAMVVISGGLMILLPPDQTYVGFSALLHAGAAWCGLLILAGGDGFGGLILLVLLGKLGLEAMGDSLPTMMMPIEGEVSHLSHALGVAGGGVAARLAGAPRRIRMLRAALVILMIGFALLHGRDWG